MSWWIKFSIWWSTGKTFSKSINRTPSIKVSRLLTYWSIFKVDWGWKIGSHPHKVDCKVDYPTCWIPLLKRACPAVSKLFIKFLYWSRGPYKWELMLMLRPHLGKMRPIWAIWTKSGHHIKEASRGGNREHHTAGHAWHFTCDLQLSRSGKYLFVSQSDFFLTDQSKWKGILPLCWHSVYTSFTIFITCCLFDNLYNILYRKQSSPL